MFAIVAWITCSFAVGLFANALGRSGAVWFIFSLILSPSLGLMVVAVLDKKWTRSARVMTAIAPAVVSLPI
ncbi:hypothetical protein CupriaWKF_33875 [Cupriavidus sp. WKF15]|uniref:hypothetical protein n=1 Tax=Cupriavidus sp. WKF15 TaxID=3032282 RepID=UPI0023E1FA50|nr:hypothetical protein [Cupriavidus sp. WKF15]WER50516.1 hypothetical protein CupriaWKF_33875 [Cupriavidus sp. WKF15]